MTITRRCCAQAENGLDGFIKLGLPGSGRDGIDRVNLGKAQNSINLLLQMGLWGYFGHSEDPQVILPLSLEPI